MSRYTHVFFAMIPQILVIKGAPLEFLYRGSQDLGEAAFIIDLL